MEITNKLLDRFLIENNIKDLFLNNLKKNHVVNDEGDAYVIYKSLGYRILPKDYNLLYTNHVKYVNYHNDNYNK